MSEVIILYQVLKVSKLAILIAKNSMLNILTYNWNI
jgi:hypothetical protein